MRRSFGDCWKLSAKLSFWFYQCLILLLLMLHDPISMFHCTTILCKINLNCGRISSDGRVSDCRVGGQKFNSRGRTNTQDLKMLQMARPLRGSDAWPCKIAVVDVKIVSPIITFVLNTLTLKLSAFLFFSVFFFLSQTTFAAVVLQWVISLKRILHEFLVLFSK